jgi:hypothetical protein
MHFKERIVMNKKIPELVLSELAERAQRLSKELHEQLMKMSNGQLPQHVKDANFDTRRKLREGW